MQFTADPDPPSYTAADCYKQTVCGSGHVNYEYVYPTGSCWIQCILKRIWTYRSEFCHYADPGSCILHSALHMHIAYVSNCSDPNSSTVVMQHRLKLADFLKMFCMYIIIFMSFCRIFCTL